MSASNTFFSPRGSKSYSTCFVFSFILFFFMMQNICLALTWYENAGGNPAVMEHWIQEEGEPPVMVGWVPWDGKEDLVRDTVLQTDYTNAEFDIGQNIMFNGNGHTVTLSEGARVSIGSGSKLKNCIIKNTNISENSYNNIGIQIENCKFYGSETNPYIGSIFIDDISEIRNCEFYTRMSIKISHSKEGDGGGIYNSLFEDLKAYKYSGFYFDWPVVYHKGDDLLQNFTIEGNGFDGFTSPESVDGAILELTGENIKITENILQESSIGGIRIRPGHKNCVIKNNQIVDNDYHGINVLKGENIEIESNTLNRNLKGILLSGDVVNGIIKNNDCGSNNDAGIEAWGGTDVRIESNTLTQNGSTNDAALRISSTSNVVISENSISANPNAGDGIQLASATGGTVSSNTINGHSNGSGIQILEGSNNRLTSNTVADGKTGIKLAQTTRNHLTGNIMRNNVINFDLPLFRNSDPDYVNQTIDTSNTINGKPVYFLRDQENMTVPSGAGYVALIDCTYILVENAQYWSNGHGILLYNTIDSEISNCGLKYNKFGIGIYGSSTNNVIHDCAIENSLQAGGTIDASDNNEFYQNTFHSNSYDGLLFFKSEDNYIHENKFISTKFWGLGFFSFSNNNIVRDNEISNGAIGMMINESTGNEIERNKVTGTTNAGISIQQADGNTCRNNGILGCAIGMALHKANNNTLNFNVIQDNEGDGIQFTLSNSNQFCKNLVKKNGGSGIALIDSQNNEIGDYREGNIIVGNAGNGVRIANSENETVSSGNTVDSNLIGIEANGEYRPNKGYAVKCEAETTSNTICNNFINSWHPDDDTGDDAYDEGSNNWDKGQRFLRRNIIGGKYVAGNYWNKFPAIDQDFNGIAENDYAVAGGSSVDHYPLSRWFHSGPKGKMQLKAGDPVNMSNGAYEFEIPLTLGNEFNYLNLKLIYSSGQQVTGMQSFLPDQAQRFRLTCHATAYADPGTGENGTFEFVLPNNKHVTIDANGVDLETKLQTYNQLEYTTDYVYLFHKTDKLVYIFKRNVYGEHHGQLRYIQDRNGNQLTFSYDENDVLTRIANDWGYQLNFLYKSYTYNWHEKPYTDRVLDTITDQNGRTLSFAYDENASDNGEILTLRSITLPGNATVSFSYQAIGGYKGLVNSVQYPEENSHVKINYQLAKLHDPDLADYTWLPDITKRPRVASQTDPFNNTQTFNYDEKSNHVTSQRPDGTETAFEHHGPLEHPKSYTDPANNSITFTKNDNDKLSEVRDRGEKTSLVTFDETSGKPASFTNAASKTISYTYSTQTQTVTHTATDESVTFDRRNLTRVDYPDGTYESMTYNAQGNMEQKTDRAGNTSTYQYNAAGQLMKMTNPRGGEKVFTYQ